MLIATVQISHNLKHTHLVQAENMHVLHVQFTFKAMQACVQSKYTIADHQTFT